MKLYYVPRTRSGRPRWLLEELGVPYELIRVDPKTTRDPEHRKLHPLGHVPAFTDGAVTFFESAAIVAYLADKYPDKHLAPAPGSPERGPYYQWLFVAMTDMERAILDFAQHSARLPEGERVPHLAATAKQQLDEIVQLIERTLADRPFLLGSHLTAADVMVGGTLIWANMLGLVGDYPAVKAYIARLRERPALQRASGD